MILAAITIPHSHERTARIVMTKDLPVVLEVFCHHLLRCCTVGKFFLSASGPSHYGRHVSRVYVFMFSLMVHLAFVCWNQRKKKGKR